MQTRRRSFTWRERVRYRFDQAMSRGTPALVALLALLSLAIVAASAAVLTLTGLAPEGREPFNFIDAAWDSLMHTLDTTRVDSYTGWGFRAVMILVTIGGIFIVSAFVGVLTSGLENRFAQLRQGRSLVVERGHILVLGWSPKVFTIVSELARANADQPHPRIVILADKDKVEMEQDLRARAGRTGRVQVICRTGNPIDPYDIRIANPDDARVILILSPADADDPDSQVIKSILALARNGRGGRPRHIVAEIQKRANLEVAQLAGGGQARLILSGDLIARMTMQTARQCGLSAVYNELLGFEGYELYFRDEPALVGRTYAEALLAYEECAVAGLRYADGRVQLNPPMDTRIRAGDRLILAARDDSAIRLSPEPAAGAADRPGAGIGIRADDKRPERFLVLGWNSQGGEIVSQLDGYVQPGSELLVVADMGDPGPEIAALAGELRNLAASFREGNTTDRATLEQLGAADFQRVLVLCYADQLDAQEADARTMATLLFLRDMASRGGAGRRAFTIVSQLLDGRNRELAEVARADDFIVSENMVSLLMAQVAENLEIADVFSDLFAIEGSEIYLEPAAQYADPGRPTPFSAVVDVARRRGESAIGYRLSRHAQDAARSHGVVISPAKSAPLTFEEGDCVIVLAESD
jgi:voltage-gated potassium channel Kch